MEKEQKPGKYILWWDGTDASGNRLAEGLYIIRISTGNQPTSRKVLKTVAY